MTALSMPPTAEPATRRTTDPVTPLTGRRLVGVVMGVGVLALAARLAVVLLGGGLRGVGNYDDGVYFSAATALVNGRLPYRDFLFLQPPGILLVLAPFAALGAVIGDARAFELGRLAFLVLGATNASLVANALRRSGTAAALTGGVFYALFLPAVYSERSTLLEPVGSFGVLVASAVIAAPVDRAGRSRTVEVLAGFALGLGVVVKLFYGLPALLLLLAARGRRWALFAGCVGAAALATPLVLVAPGPAWRQVVLDQLGRPRTATSLVGRLRSILEPVRLPGLPTLVALLAAVLVIAVLCVVTVRATGGAVPVVLFVSAVLVLMTTPSYYRHYAALAVPPLALVVGIGTSRWVALVAPPDRRRFASALVVVVVAAGCLSGWWGAGVRSFVRPPVPAALNRAVAAVDGCVTADDPAVLIWADALTATLRRGCPFWPDTTGWLYDADRAPSGRPAAPEDNPAWQDHAYAYLTSGDATVLIRQADGLSAATRARIGVTAEYGPKHYVFRVFPH